MAGNVKQRYNNALPKPDDQELEKNMPQTMNVFCNEIQGMLPLLASFIDRPADGDQAGQARHDNLMRAMDNIGESADVIKRAQARCEKKSQEVYMLPIVSKLPDLTGNGTDMPTPSAFRLTFSGNKDTGSNETTLFDFLERVTVQIEQSKLNEELGMKFLRRQVTGQAAELLRAESRNAKLTLEGMYRKLEVVYGQLLLPESARLFLFTMKKKPDESLLTFSARLRSTSFMAARMLQRLKPDWRKR